MAAANAQGIARKFHRAGWLGVWLQLAVGIPPIVILIYGALRRGFGSASPFGILDYLAMIGLGILAFTTFWSYRYTRLARVINDPTKETDWVKINRTLRIGIWASTIGVVVSILLLMMNSLRLLYLFLKAPQGGVPVLRTEAADRAYWVSAIDVVSLFTEICTLVGELIVVGLSIWLLFAVLKHLGVFKRAEPAQQTVIEE